MAQQVKISLLDDVDGSEAAETVRFGLDGRTYEIDMSADNAAKLRAVFVKYTRAGRVVSGRARTATAGRKPRSTDPGRMHAIREWAQAQGYAVSARGRIPGEVLRAYEQARGSAAVDAADMTAMPAEPSRSAVSLPLFSGL
jgi:hypothetical protein